MAEQGDRESRTEQPTDKRLNEAIEKGNVPFSREAVTFGSLLALTIVCYQLLPWAAIDMAGSLGTVLSHAGEIELSDREATANLATALVVAVSSLILPIMAVLAAGTIVASLAQNVPSLVAERIKPKPSRLSPASGWSRILGKAGLIEFAKSLVKLASVSVVTTLVLRGHIDEFRMALTEDPILLPTNMLVSVSKVITVLCIFSLLLAVADITWSRVKWRRDLRMTRHEVKEEMKQAEGDPHIKARIRSVARQMSSRRMIDNVQTATMVIANPTHFAVALRYDRDQSGAPLVVAKGVDYMALKIREIAGEHRIPIIEDKPLARALYDSVPLDSQIPPEFYRAVAEIIHYLNSRRRGVIFPVRH